MANEHIGRLQQIGLGKESTSGTGVAATFWLPKRSGSFSPVQEVAEDDSAYGVIDAVKEVQIVKNMTKVNVSAIARDEWFGNILMACFGTTYGCVEFPVTSISGDFVVGETITETTSSATGELRRIDQSGTGGILWIDPATGVFTGGQTLTGGTSAATATGGTIAAVATVRTHLFDRLNTNAHRSYTIYGHDPIGDERAMFCMLNTLELEAAVGDFLTFSAEFMGKKLESTSAQTPSYTEERSFLAKHATLTHAADFDTLLSTPVTASIERLKLTINKNLTDYQAWGDDDVASLHNQQFEVFGDMDLLYNAATWRDYMTNSTKQALRIKLVHGDTIGTNGAPTLQIDLPECYLTEWSRSEENNGLVKQTVGFKAVFNVGRSLTAQAILENEQLTDY